MRVLTLVLTRVWRRAETGALTLGLAGVELTTMAFLVAFKLLISDFFWMVTVGSSRLIFEFLLLHILPLARGLPNRSAIKQSI